MLEIIRKREEERKELIDRAKSFVKKCKKLGKISAILYGSLARGDFNLWSDVDVIVISELFPEDILKRQEILCKLAPPRIEAKGYTKKEFLEMIKKNHPFLKVLKKEGIFLINELNLRF